MLVHVSNLNFLLVSIEKWANFSPKSMGFGVQYLEIDGFPRTHGTHPNGATVFDEYDWTAFQKFLLDYFFQPPQEANLDSKINLGPEAPCMYLGTEGRRMLYGTPNK